MLKRQGCSCHIVTKLSSCSSSQKSAIFARDRPHDLLRHMTISLYNCATLSLAKLPWDISSRRKTVCTNRVCRQSGFPTFISCQRQDPKVLPKRRQSHQGDKLCDVSTVPLVARWPVFLARGSDADGEPHLTGTNYDQTCSVLTTGYDPMENDWIIVVEVSTPHWLPRTRRLVASRLGPSWRSGLGFRLARPIG